MRNRTPLMLGICLLVSSLLQAQRFDYDDYFYYRNHQYLQTVSLYLSGAQLKVGAGDTAAAIPLLIKAAHQGMYDTTYITGRKSLQFITGTPHWQQIKQTVAANRQRYGNPRQMEIHTDDIERFWKVYPAIFTPQAEQAVLRDYILAGTHGLRTFFEVRMSLRANGLIQEVRKKPKYYESIRDVSLNLGRYRPILIEAAVKLKELYPEAIFPPTYLLMSHFTAFGTADGGAGQLIGAEFLCNKSTADTTQLGQWEKTNLTDSSKLPGILIHELVHIEQNTKQAKTLLERSINEGACDFITQLVLGYNINTKLHDYGNANERALWEKFNKQKDGENVDEWLYNGVDDGRGYPGDLGYYMGYKICEAYYEKAADKKAAIKAILEIQDFSRFLQESGYAQKW